MTLPIYPAYFSRLIPSGPIPVPMLLVEQIEIAGLGWSDYLVTVDGRVVQIDREYLEQATIDKITHLDVTRVSAITFGLEGQRIAVADLRDDASFVGLGKFSNQYEEYLYGLALDSDDRVGHCDEIGYVATRVDFASPSPFSADGYLPQDATLGQYRDVFEEIPASVIMFENDRGILSFDYFETLRATDLAWLEITAHVDAFYDEWDKEES